VTEEELKSPAAASYRDIDEELEPAPYYQEEEQRIWGWDQVGDHPARQATSESNSELEGDIHYSQAHSTQASSVSGPGLYAGSAI